MRVAIGSDHAGFELKNLLRDELIALGDEVKDFGTNSAESMDYPDVAIPLATEVSGGDFDFGILICSNGVGPSIVANKVHGIRAAVCHDVFSAHQGVEDDDMNVLCLGARVIGRNLVMDIVKTFLGAKYTGLDRHQRRLDKVNAIEKEFCK